MGSVGSYLDPVCLLVCLSPDCSFLLLVVVVAAGNGCGGCLIGVLFRLEGICDMLDMRYLALARIGDSFDEICGNMAAS